MTDPVAVLRHFASRYVASCRTGGELRSRLVAITHQRAQWMEAIDRRHNREFAQRQLAEVDRVRRTLERSARVATERTQALEAVIAAVARGAAPPAEPRPLVTPAEPARVSVTAVGPSDIDMRGAWSRPER